MDQLARLPEEEAIRAFSDGRNQRILYRLLLLFALVAVATALLLISWAEYPRLILPVVQLLLIRWLYAVREGPFFLQRFHPLLVAFLTIQLLLVRGAFFYPDQGFHGLDYLLPLALLFFHLPSLMAAVPLAGLWAVSSGRHLLMVAWGDTTFNFAGLIGQTAVVIVVVSLAGSLRIRRQHQFLANWRNENRRHRERIRLREELDAARRIQLSMLPRGDPKLPWLDVAGISIPASEVGGDYYDYLRFTDDQLAIVVGDVSGHGVASGLLLSGIRSCLYLLQETPLPPVEILAKLDRMIRKTTGRRVLVTMLYALFDQRHRRMIFSAAAHPPLIYGCARRREISELGLEALPLGTRIGSTLQQQQVEYESGDFFVFVTDGIAEITNPSGRFYGSERLIDCLGRLSDDQHTAKEIRDAILNDIWNFKGDGQQTDDITLVVVKVR